MDEDWRGLDSEWLLRVTRRFLESLDDAGSVEAILAGVGREELEVAFADVRACLDAVGSRTIRPIMRSSASDVGTYPGVGRLEALASELGGGRDGVQHLSLPELMAEHPEDPADGMAIVQKLLLLGFCRREYPALGVTHRYHCRDHERRAELQAQMMAWLAPDD
jgi:hypothetical protein